MGLAPIFCFNAMYRQNNALLELLEPAVGKMGYRLLGIEQFSQGRSALIRIYIDHEGGINLDDCQRVSEQVSGILDVNDPIRGTYTLEVSSPGLDRPFFTLEQMQDYIGSTIKVNLRNRIDGRRNLTGILMAVDVQNVSIKMDDVEYLVNADNIDRARLVAD